MLELEKTYEFAHEHHSTGTLRKIRFCYRKVLMDVLLDNSDRTLEDLNGPWRDVLNGLPWPSLLSKRKREPEPNPTSVGPTL